MLLVKVLCLTNHNFAGKLSGEEMEDMLKNMRLAAPAGDEVLVQLLTRWASASRRTAAPSQSCRRESAGMTSRCCTAFNVLDDKKCDFAWP